MTSAREVIAKYIAGELPWIIEDARCFSDELLSALREAGWVVVRLEDKDRGAWLRDARNHRWP